MFCLGNLSKPATEEEKLSKSIFTVTQPTSTSLLLDGQASEFDGVPKGGTLGRHTLGITTTRAFLTDYTSSTGVPLTAGANVTFDSAADMFTKSNSGNSWNAWFQSTDHVILAGQDGIVSWPIEPDFDNDGDTGAQGTVREMGGLDDNPSANASYSSGEFMLYQVNATTVYVYENGSNKGSFPQPMNVGDRLGIKIVDGEVFYIHIRGTTETVITKSTKTTNQDLYFKGALNRGVGSSGHASMGDVQLHSELENRLVTAYIHGAANEFITSDDVVRLLNVGLNVNTGSTYSLVSVEKIVSTKYPLGTYRILHDYSVTDSQSIVEV